MDRFSTARLRAERMTPAHLSEVLRIHQDVQVMAHLGGVRDEAETTAYVERNVAHWATYGFGFWILRDPTTQQVMGRGGLRHLDVDGADEVELGYAFFPQHWSQGLATEFAAACVAIADLRLRLRSVVAVATPTNQASQRVMVKAGFVYERDVVASGVPVVLFRRVLAATMVRNPT